MPKKLATHRLNPPPPREGGPKPAPERKTAAQRGYGAAWQRATAAFRLAHPLCVECLKVQTLTPATVTDHIIPHKGDAALFWDQTNWQPLCKRHHDSKTAREDGGFGRKHG